MVCQAPPPLKLVTTGYKTEKLKKSRAICPEVNFTSDMKRRIFQMYFIQNKDVIKSEDF